MDKGPKRLGVFDAERRLSHIFLSLMELVGESREETPRGRRRIHPKFASKHFEKTEAVTPGNQLWTRGARLPDTYSVEKRAGRVLQHATSSDHIEHWRFQMAAPTVPVPSAPSQDNNRYAGRMIESLLSIVETAGKKIQSHIDDNVDMMLERESRVSTPLTIDEVLDGSRRSQ
jgi:hypothetical protein